ncbi:MAG: hypothetical protein ACK55Z_12410, partial [bacterium]
VHILEAGRLSPSGLLVLKLTKVLVVHLLFADFYLFLIAKGLGQPLFWVTFFVLLFKDLDSRFFKGD